MSRKLTQLDADMIRVFSEFGFSKPQLAQEYHIHTDTVRNVLNYKSFPKKEQDGEVDRGSGQEDLL